MTFTNKDETEKTLRDLQNHVYDQLVALSKPPDKAWLEETVNKFHNPHKSKYTLFTFIRDFIDKAPTRITPKTNRPVSYKQIREYERTFYYLKETRKPPVDIFRNLKIPMAVSTDLNPGTSPVHSMTLILNMACMLFGLTCEEALLGSSINGAKALGLENTKGSIEKGKDADLVLWDIDTPADLCYLAGFAPVEMVMIKGDKINF